MTGRASGIKPREGQGADTTEEDRSHHKREETEMVRARSANGGQQTAKTRCTLGYEQYWKKEKAWKTTKELDRHHATRFEKHRHDLGSSATARCQQRRLALTCGPMCL